jgi:hypothetical protein
MPTRQKRLLVTILLICVALWVGYWFGLSREPYFFLTKRFWNEAARIEKKWASYFYSPEKIENTSIVEFKLIRRTDNSTFAIKEDELDALYRSLCYSRGFGPNAKNAIRVFPNYSCTFSDGERLEYVTNFELFEDRTFMYLFYPQDATVFVQLEGVLSDNTLKELRGWLLEGRKPPVFMEN